MRLQEVCTFVTVPPTGGGLVLGIRRNRNRRRAHRGGGSAVASPFSGDVVEQPAGSRIGLKPVREYRFGSNRNRFGRVVECFDSEPGSSFVPSHVLLDFLTRDDIFNVFEDPATPFFHYAENADRARPSIA